MPLDATSQVSDDALMVLFANGDSTAAQTLTLRLLPGCFSLARRLLNNEAEAEDAAQEAMLKLWRAAPKWRAGEAKVSTWLYRVTTNHCLDLLRKKRPQGLPENFDMADESPPVEARLIATDRQLALNKAMAALPERQRVALHLRHFDERPNPLAALLLDQKEALGLP